MQFLGLAKSILTLQQVVPYLGFASDSVRKVFHLLLNKKAKFLALIQDVLAASSATVKTLQRLVGKLFWSRRSSRRGTTHYLGRGGSRDMCELFPNAN